MAEVIKELRVKDETGEFKDSYSFGVDAVNVDLEDGSSLEEVIKNMQALFQWVEI